MEGTKVEEKGFPFLPALSTGPAPKAREHRILSFSSSISLLIVSKSFSFYIRKKQTSSEGLFFVFVRQETVLIPSLTSVQESVTPTYNCTSSASHYLLILLMVQFSLHPVLLSSSEHIPP